MPIVQMDVDHRIEGLLRGVGVGAPQGKVAACLLAQEIEALKTVCRFQPVEIVHGGAELGVAVFAHGHATVFLFDIMELLADGRVFAKELTHATVLYNKEGLTVVEHVHVLNGQQEVAEGLDRDIAIPTVRHHVDSVGGEIHLHVSAVALVGACATLEILGVFVGGRIVYAQNVDENPSLVGALEGIVVPEVYKILITVKVGRVAVFPRENAGVILHGKAELEANVLIFFDIAVHQIVHQRRPVCQGEVRHVGVSHEINGVSLYVLKVVEIEAHVL